MTTRRAAQLHLTVEGDPSRVWVCHCLECQRRTVAVDGDMARFHRDQIAFNGTATAWRRPRVSLPPDTRRMAKQG